MEDIPVPQEEVPVEDIPVPQEESAPENEASNEEDDSEDSGDDNGDDEFGEPDFDVPPPVREKSVRELMDEVKDNPMVLEAMDLFGGKLTDVYVNN